MTNLSFREKITIGTLIAVAMIGILYLHSALSMWQAGQLHPASNLGLATGLTVLLVIVLVAYHILIALTGKPEAEDERDRLISWRAGNIGGMVDDPVAGSPVLIANALMAAVFIATVVELVMTLVFYRRGI